MFTNFGLLDFNTPELLIILAIILLLFGSKKLPELSRSLGESARELRKGLSDNVHEQKAVETETENSSNQHGA
jgi:sec-independent protein translocase protein TatA